MAKNKFQAQEPSVVTDPILDTVVPEGTDAQDPILDASDVATQVDSEPQVQVDGGLTEGQDQDVEDNQQEPELTQVQEPEVKQEPDVETQPEVPAEDEEPAELDVTAEIQRVNALINDSTLTPDFKLDQVAISPFLAISIVGGKLKDYKDIMHRDNGQLELKQGASRNNQLYKAIMSVLKQEDDEIFKAGFNLINIIFKSFASEDEAFNHYSLTRYDAGWDNQKDLSTYNKLCVVITTLADAKTREELKTTIDFNKLRDRDKTNFTDKIVDRLVSYYNV